MQELPLGEAAPLPAGEPARKPPAPRKAAPRKTAEAKAAESDVPATQPGPPVKQPPAKRAAASLTETPEQQVVPVPAAGRAESMPPTDLDVVDVFDELPSPLDDEIVLVDEPEVPASTEPEEPDGPTGPISLRERPQPAPLGARPAPPGGPPAL